MGKRRGSPKNPPWKGPGYEFFFVEQYTVKYVNGDSLRQVIASAKCKTITTVLNSLQLHMCVSLLKEQLMSWSLIL